MKALQISFVVLIAAASTCFAGPSAAQVTNRTFEKTIEITTRTIRIDSLLKAFSRQTGAGFSFNSNKISPSKKLPVAKQRQTLSRWLDVLRDSMGVQHKIMGNHIILMEGAGSPKATPGRTTAKTSNSKRNMPAKRSPDQPGKTASKPVQQSTSNAPVVEETKAPVEVAKAETPPSQPAAPAIPAKPPITETKPDSASQPKKAIPPAKAVPPTTAIPERAEATRSFDNREAFQGMMAYSKHGSGDMQGIVFGASYTTYLSKKFSLNYDLKGSMHSSEDTYTGLRFTTAGVQLGVNAQLSVIRSLQHEVMIGLGAFGRYQSASNGSDGYSTYTPQQTGVPAILIGFDNRTKQKTFAVGGLLQVEYNYTFGNNLFTGIVGGFQTDNNGDLLVQAGITIGKRF